jgi:hypothetical protein
MAFESPVSKGILSWWSDCYGECPRMFYQAFAGIPELGPSHENHILYSEGILRDVHYNEGEVKYSTCVGNGKEYLRLAFRPALIKVNGTEIFERKVSDTDYYNLRKLGQGDYALTVRHTDPGEIEILSTNGLLGEVSGLRHR